MFNNKYKRLKSEIESLKAFIVDLEERLTKLEDPHYFDWKSMALANEELAAKQGHWYLNSRTDVQLLEQIISEINKNDELTALFTTSDGCTLSLRVSPRMKPNNYLNSLNKFNEDEA